jgi:hypothetical protein
MRSLSKIQFVIALSIALFLSASALAYAGSKAERTTPVVKVTISGPKEHQKPVSSPEKPEHPQTPVSPPGKYK